MEELILLSLYYPPKSTDSIYSLSKSQRHFSQEKKKKEKNRNPHAKSWLIGKDPDAGRGLGAGGEGDDRGWDGWMASSTPWTWVWVNSGSWWWTGRPGMLRFMGLQRVGHYWGTELNWTENSYGINRDCKNPKWFWERKTKMEASHFLISNFITNL